MANALTQHPLGAFYMKGLFRTGLLEHCVVDGTNIP